MIESYGYVVKNKDWKQTSNRLAKLSTKIHAEITNYNGMMGFTPLLFLQNAFPCNECDRKFMEEIFCQRKTSVIIKILQDKGGYSADHGYGNNNPVPGYLMYIWYFNGIKTISNNINGQPNNFSIYPPINFTIYIELSKIKCASVEYKRNSKKTS